MRKEIHKWFWAWDFDKEEQWLNELSAQGLALIAVGWCKYIFEDAEPGAYQIRLEFLDQAPTHAESQQYLKFLEDAGGEYLGHVHRWVYLRGKQGFALHSDYASRIKHLNRILTLLTVTIAMYLYNCFNVTNMVLRTYGSKGWFAVSVVLAVIVCAVILLCLWGMVNILRKRRTLKKLQQLYEG